MKKLTFLVTNSEYNDFIEQIRQLGVVHVQQLQQGATSAQLSAALSLEQRFQTAIAYLEKKSLSETAVAELPSVEGLPTDPVELLSYVEDMQKRENATLHAIDAARANAAALEPWGDFDQEALAQLAEETGLQVGFYSCSAKAFNAKWKDECFATPISDVQKRTYFLTFSEELPQVTAERLELPIGTYTNWVTRTEEEEKNLLTLQAEYLAIHAELLPLLQMGALQAKDDISLEKVKLSDQSLAEDSVRLLVGWTKADTTEPLLQYLDTNHIYYELADPAFTDDVPVSLTNNSFSRLFEPILNMYSLPSYNDLDPTVYFAPFFMLFFGLCMGDAGYGLLILIAGIVLALKGQGDMRGYGRLACWLGGMTVLCGFATSTFFGINIAEQGWAWVEPVKPYFLTDAGVGKIFGYTPMMVLSVFIGLVQVLLGMLLKARKLWNNYGFGYAIGTYSWFVALLAAILVFGLPACGFTLPVAVTYVLYALIGVSVVGIFLYNNPAAYKNPILGPLLNIGGGMWETYGMSTGLLGDLLSYIRLFALGLTGGVLGGVFNSLAYDLCGDLPAPANWLAMAVILLLGHGITFALSMISAFVHPMRLTFVEFFKNSDFSGGGKAYEPFHKEVVTTE